MTDPAAPVDVWDRAWDVTVVIPTIPTRDRRRLLARATESAVDQTRPPVAVSVAVDPAASPWVAFLDDDDEFKPVHLERTPTCAAATGADYVFSWFDTRYCHRHRDPLGHFGKVFDPAAPHHTTTTVVVRTELARRVGFTPPAPEDTVGGEDWRFTLDCVAAGARIVHLPERTWYWHHDRGGGTSGLPTRWVPT